MKNYKQVVWVWKFWNDDSTTFYIINVSRMYHHTRWLNRILNQVKKNVLLNWLDFEFSVATKSRSISPTKSFLCLQSDDDAPTTAPTNNPIINKTSQIILILENFMCRPTQQTMNQVKCFYATGLEDFQQTHVIVRSNLQITWFSRLHPIFQLNE